MVLRDDAGLDGLGGSVSAQLLRLQQSHGSCVPGLLELLDPVVVTHAGASMYSARVLGSGILARLNRQLNALVNQCPNRSDPLIVEFEMAPGPSFRRFPVGVLLRNSADEISQHRLRLGLIYGKLLLDLGDLLQPEQA
jgi:hypothetical protein